MRLLITLLLMTTAAHAQGTPPKATIEDKGGVRYQMQDTPEGTVRLDTRTGEMTLCQTKDGRLLCRMGADERAALMGEIERLDARIDALEKGRSSTGSDALSPDEERQIDKALSAAERLMRGLGAIARDMRSGQ